MKTIITGVFQQETNRYAAGVMTQEHFQQVAFVCNQEEVFKTYAGVRKEMGAFMDFFANKFDYRLVAPFAFEASPGPVVAQDVWQAALDHILGAIAAQPNVDGILLALHGAMVTEEFEDAEGELLERIRAVVGPKTPIVITLDLHVNMTMKMMENATAFFVYDYYPHTDAYEVAFRAAECIYETIEGRMKPVMSWKKLDMIMPYMPTDEAAFAPFLAKAQMLRTQKPMVNVNICHGFFASDIYDQGAAVIAVADGDIALTQKTADELAEELYAKRKTMTRSYYTAQEAVKLAMESREFPMVLADVNDNPGSGASTDAPQLLKALLDAKAKDVAVAVIYDPETVLAAEKAGVGSVFQVSLGGKIVPEITGGPLCCEAYVRAITDGSVLLRGPMRRGSIRNFGKCALLQIEGISVIVSSYRVQPFDLEIYRHFGIHPEEMKILVVKSAVHFRADFSSVAKRILDVLTPAEAPQRPQDLPLNHSRRPIYPLDDI